jgi:hypothetical protein
MVPFIAILQALNFQLKLLQLGIGNCLVQIIATVHGHSLKLHSASTHQFLASVLMKEFAWSKCVSYA